MSHAEGKGKHNPVLHTGMYYRCTGFGKPARRGRRFPCQHCFVRTPSFRSSGPLPPPRLLAAARLVIGMSQRELAAAAGVATSSLSDYEAGRSTLRSDTFNAVLAVLRKHRIRFIDETDEIEMGFFVEKARASMPEATKQPGR